MTLLIAIPISILVARAKLAELPDETRWLIGYGTNWLFAIFLAKALIERLWFHRTDGILARQSQRTSEAIAYLFPLILIGLTVGFTVIAFLGLFDPSSVVLGVCSGLPTGALFPWFYERMYRAWQRFAPKGLRFLAHARVSPRKAAMVSGAIGLSSLLVPSDHHIDALLIGTYILIVLLLTASVDAHVVRYMTLIGRSTSSLLSNWLPLQVALLAPMTIVLIIGQAWVPASLAVISLLALPLVTAMRIFAYRAFGRLIADWTVALVVGAAIYAGFTVPPLGPVVIVAGLFWLAKRGAGRRWLLA